MNYDFRKIEEKWQKFWADNQTFKAENHSDKPKYYVLDMFPYPSGAGLHVGHPLGYIASDIYARYKRHKGFNVLHPMGYDSFGLPAEQYAIQTGQHPADTTKVNIEGGVDKEGNKIEGYRKQLDRMGFSFDWSREVRTSDPKYYKWTQWVFIQLFNSWYNKDTDKAEAIGSLISKFETEGNAAVNAVCDDETSIFTQQDWKNYSDTEKQQVLLKYRLTYLADTEVNWCPALGTVLANDEIVNGVSERGGHPVIRKKMTQWSMRITAYAQRLLDGLNKVDWPQPLKDSQTNWIGRSEGAEVTFPILAFPEGEGTTPGYMTGGNNSHLLLEKAKKLRNNPAQAEAALWESLKGKNLGDKFRRQHLIDDFIVDFVCLSKKLIVEVDGDIHDTQKAEDEARTKALNERGFEVVRFRNNQVLGDIDAVLQEIKEILVKKSIPPSGARGISVFTTRPDTIFGVSFMTLAPEHDLVAKITTPDQKAEVEAYVEATAKRSERDRMADVKTITGAFTGAYAEHPFTKEPIPIWIGDYVLAGYGTGAVMSVPCGDQRDYDFAKHFNIPIPNIFEGVDISEEAFSDKATTVIANSDFLNGLNYKEATTKAIVELEKLGQGEGKINYRLRDAVFSRQRYWGEPFPVYYVEGMPQMIDEKYLPIKLPEVEKYLPTETGEPPLGNATVWAWDVEKNEVVSNDLIDHKTVFPLELNTMPGWAGSSQYFNRYMDPHNEDAIYSPEAINYWQDVDLYIGGSEHATGHLLYSRFWQKFLFDRGVAPKDEFAKKLINQGMITGTSALAYLIREDNKEHFVSRNWYNKLVSDLSDPSKEKMVPPDTADFEDILKRLTDGTTEVSTWMPIHVDVSLVNASDELDIQAFKNWRPEFKDAIFTLDNGEIYKGINPTSGKPGGEFIVSREVEKMSKSKYNVVSPDAICEEYGADSLRLYEMFLGPLEQSKPWNTAGITGAHSFLKKLWKLYFEESGIKVTDEAPSAESLKTLHKTIKKVEEDIENFSFNTSVSTFMICVNELTAQKCTSRSVLEPLAILVSPYAPHIAEELWAQLGHSESIATAPFPKFEQKYLVESSKEYPISFNGKMRFKLELPLDLSKEEIEAEVMAHEKTQAQLQGRTPKKVIVVPGKIVNVVG
ncbi:class I tRNA ligase family protein [uncultured Kriegella sp.]|uniref:leucine--tRNA ligase n=1 Tax=uncultured Kriegella sp. TaxID=1798910 RepID=UPI0030DB82CA|tara:strand:- start:11023 stop:14424 length:3402 start_codon:yes stop_codon:yes gene_type:complete